MAQSGADAVEGRIAGEVRPFVAIDTVIVEFFLAIGILREPPVRSADRMVAAPLAHDGGLAAPVTAIAQQRHERLPVNRIA